MVRAATTKEQNSIAKETGQGLFCFACKSGGTFNCDGPIPHDMAKPLIRLMAYVAADRLDAKKLQRFVDSIEREP